jgi:hypothetical protein
MPTVEKEFGVYVMRRRVEDTGGLTGFEYQGLLQSHEQMDFCLPWICGKDSRIVLLLWCCDMSSSVRMHITLTMKLVFIYYTNFKLWNSFSFIALPSENWWYSADSSDVWTHQTAPVFSSPVKAGKPQPSLVRPSSVKFDSIESVLRASFTPA